MIRALIADDEALSRRALHQLLERHADVTIVAECQDGAEARDAMDALEPDVAFLDIRMPLATGLDLARARGKSSTTLVVFVTAFDKFALPAFEADTVDYLTKPLSEARFDEALDRVRERVRMRRDAEAFAARSHGGMGRRSRYVSQLMTRIGTLDVVIPLETIDYIQADDVYAAVVSRNKRQLIRTPLDVLERVLDPQLFARIHRSYIVRLDRVTAMRRHAASGAAIVVEGGGVLPVSRRRRARIAGLLASVTGGNW
jgi:two-component system LytT family response regulator